jgi:carnitine-CoA ligase
VKSQVLPATHPFMGRDVSWLLRTRVELCADKPFLIFAAHERAHTQLSYSDFYRRVTAVATGLHQQGINPGDKVIIHLNNCLEYLIAWFACARIQAVAVMTNAYSAQGEMQYFAEHSGARAAITQPELYPVIKNSGVSFDWIACLEQDPDGEHSAAFPKGALPFCELELTGSEPPELVADPSAPCSIMYTSGTTSRPKGVVYTHANVLWGAQRNASHCELRPDDVSFTFLPLFHSNAFGYSMLSTLWIGATLVIQPKFSPKRFWEVACRYRCTWTSVGPFVGKSLKTLPYPKQHWFRFWGNIKGNDSEALQEWGIPSLGWWGMTETISHPILSDMHFPSAETAMGRPMPEYGVCIVDEQGHSVPLGETGLLKIKGIPGLSLFLEYLNDPEKTAASFDDEGWFITGDRVRLLTDGSIAFGERDNDMLKVGGENVASSEVECVIQDVPGVKEVAVVSMPHDFLSEVPVAYVVCEGDKSELVPAIEAVCETNLAKFKRPRCIEFIDDLPRSSIGKLDKKALRAMAKSLTPVT